MGGAFQFKTVTDRQFWSVVERIDWPSIRQKAVLPLTEIRDELAKEKSPEFWKSFYKTAVDKRDALMRKYKHLGVTDDFGWDFAADIIGHGKEEYEHVMNDESYTKALIESDEVGVENFEYLIPRGEND